MLFQYQLIAIFTIDRLTTIPIARYPQLHKANSGKVVVWTHPTTKRRRPLEAEEEVC
jgi:hypothetical protein